MQGYFTYLLERELNTPGFLKKIRVGAGIRFPQFNTNTHATKTTIGFNILHNRIWNHRHLSG